MKLSLAIIASICLLSTISLTSATFVKTFVVTSTKVKPITRPVVVPKVDVPNVYAALSGSDLSIAKAAIDAVKFDALLKNPNFVGTVFVPTNDAFTALFKQWNITPQQALASTDLLKTILSYHVLPKALKSTSLYNGLILATGVEKQYIAVSVSRSTGLTLKSYASTAKVVKADITAPKAVVHVVDTVLLPITPFPNCKSVAELAVAAKLDSLVAALNAANLTSAVADKKFMGTIFAPTNEAFANLLKKLGSTFPQLAANKALLTKVLNTHVLSPAVYYSFNLANGQRLTTLSGSKIAIDLVSKPGSVRVRSAGSTATVVVANVAACEAVVHVIDTVLLP